LVTAGRRDLALALLGAFAFGCTVLFSRTVAREQLASSVPWEFGSESPVSSSWAC
jgi:hypothetical protein